MFAVQRLPGASCGNTVAVLALSCAGGGYAGEAIGGGELSSGLSLPAPRAEGHSALSLASWVILSLAGARGVVPDPGKKPDPWERAAREGMRRS